VFCLFNSWARLDVLLRSRSSETREHILSPFFKAFWGIHAELYCSFSQIWSVHKRVCGVLSKPLQWPALSYKEVQQVTDLSSQPCRDTVGTRTTLRRLMNSGHAAIAPLPSEPDMFPDTETFEVSDSMGGLRSDRFPDTSK